MGLTCFHLKPPFQYRLTKNISKWTPQNARLSLICWLQKLVLNPCKILATLSLYKRMETFLLTSNRSSELKLKSNRVSSSRPQLAQGLNSICRLDWSRLVVNSRSLSCKMWHSLSLTLKTTINSSSISWVITISLSLLMRANAQLLSICLP